MIEHELWRRGELSHKLHEGQKKIYESMQNTKDSSTIILCARRFGKSYLAAIYALEYCIKNPNSFVIVTAPTKKDAYEIYTPILAKIAIDAPLGMVKPAKTEMRWKVGQSTLVFAGYDTIADSLRGRGANLVISDEVGFTSPDSFDYVRFSVLRPILQKTVGKAKGKHIYLSTPAKLPNHPFNVMWETAEEEGKLHKYTIYDNPILTEEDIEEIAREMGGKDSVDFRRECICQNVRDLGGMIIPKFNEGNIVDALKGINIAGESWIISDMGGVRDKTVIQVFGRRIEDKKVVIYHELVFDVNTDTKTIGDGIVELQRRFNVLPYHIWVDAAGQTAVDLFKLSNLSAILPPKVDKDGAIAALNAAFYNKDLYVSSDCEFTIQSMFNCTFNENRTDFMRTKKYGHADAIMTAVYGHRVTEMVSGTHGKLTYRQMAAENTELKGIASSILPTKVTWKP